MRDPLVQKVKMFLDARLQRGGPLLLGYSGGPDSKALLYLLLECRRFLDFELCLAHVDHGWRKESGAEAEAVAREAQRLNLRLFSRRLDLGEVPDRNMEASGRNQRILFFRNIYQEVQAQGLLLGHQADDQAETVLKRLLEGAHVSHLSGIEPDSEMEGMRVLRPLLFAEKKQLMDWLEKKGLVGFEDSTNLSVQFLRGRMRSEMIPGLESQFGKKIRLNLCKAGQSFSEIDAYMKRRCESYWAALVRRENGMEWDLSAVGEVLELRWLLKQWFERERVGVSYEMAQRIVEGVLGFRGEGKFPVKNGVLYVKRGRLIYILDL